MSVTAMHLFKDPRDNCLLCESDWRSGSWYHVEDVPQGLKSGERWCTPDHPLLLVAWVMES